MSSYKNSSAIVFLIIMLFSIHWLTTQETSNKFVFEKISNNKQIYYSEYASINSLFEQSNHSTTIKIKKRKILNTDVINLKNHFLIANNIFKEKIASSLYSLLNTHLSTSLNSRAPPLPLSI